MGKYRIVSDAIEQLVAELRKLPPDERERLVEHWVSSQERDAESGQAPGGEVAD